MPRPRPRIGQKNRNQDLLRLRTELNIPGSGGGGGGVDHGALGGLGDDDHSQYVHISSNRTITALHSFSPTSTQAPFSVGLNANNELVTGLRSQWSDMVYITITAGDGLSGGGELTSDRTIDMETPNTLSVSSTNTVGTGHNHAITTSSNPGATASILATDSSGYLQLERLGLEVAPTSPLHIRSYITPQFRLEWSSAARAQFVMNSIGDLAIDAFGTSGDVTIQTGDTGNLQLYPTGDIIVSPGGKDILPLTNYNINLGQISKKYLTLHAAELWVETLVAQDTIATIGGRILVGPTTALTLDIGTGTTEISVKHNQMQNGDRVYMEADGKVEFMAITSSASGIGPYTYTVTRNLDGTGANSWYAGDAVFNTGTTGDGFIDLYSLSGVYSGSGPTIVGNERTGTTYNAWDEVWAIGNLNGLYGQGSNNYGVGLGRYASGYNNILIDGTTSGILFRNYTSTIASWVGDQIDLGPIGGSGEYVRVTSTYARMSNGGGDYIQIGVSNGIEFFGQSTRRGQITTTGNFWFGDSASTERIQWDSTSGLRIYNASNQAIIQFPVSGVAKIVGTLDVSSPGVITAGGGDVTLSSQGIDIEAGDQFENRVSFLNASVHAYLECLPYSTASARLSLDADSTQESVVYVRAGYNQFITATVGGVANSSTAHVQVYPRMHITNWDPWSTTTTPSSSYRLTVDGSVFIDDGHLIQDSASYDFRWRGGAVIGSSTADIPDGDLRITGGLSIGSTSVNMSEGKGYFSDTIYINDTANSESTKGLTIRGDGLRNELFTIKSTEVAHGMTSNTETDTVLRMIRSIDGTSGGGANFESYSEGNYSLVLSGVVITPTSTTSTSAVAPVLFAGSKKSGTTKANMASSENVIVYRNGTITRMIMKGDGEIHNDYATSMTLYDKEDDIGLLDTFDRFTAGLDVADSWFVENMTRLRELGIVSSPAGDPGLMVSHQKMTKLLIGAVKQAYKRIEILEAKLA